jgi:hypothetical protein
MRTTKLLVVALASMAATAAFIVACGKGPGSASAQACTAWEVSVFNISSPAAGNCAVSPDYPASCRVGNGWEPFAVDGSNEDVILRRCAQ